MKNILLASIFLTGGLTAGEVKHPVGTMVTGKIYTPDMVKTNRSKLAGKIVRLKIERNYFSNPESTPLGYTVFVGKDGVNYGLLLFPKAAKDSKKLIKTFLKKKNGKITLYAKVTASGNMLTAVGRSAVKDFNNKITKFKW